MIELLTDALVTFGTKADLIERITDWLAWFRSIWS